MTWENRIKGQSYKGFQFNIISLSVNSGRKIVINEFPFSDNWSVQDVGIKAKKYGLEIVINHPDADLQKDNFEKLLNEKQAGYLVLPFRSPELVNVESWKADDGAGSFKYSISFVVKKEVSLLASASPLDILNELGSNLNSNASSVFLASAAFENYSPSSLAIASISILDNFLNIIIDGIGSTKDSINDSIARFKLEVATLSNKPSELYYALNNIFALENDPENLLELAKMENASTEEGVAIEQAVRVSLFSLVLEKSGAYSFLNENQALNFRKYYIETIRYYLDNYNDPSIINQLEELLILSYNIIPNEITKNRQSIEIATEESIITALYNQNNNIDDIDSIIADNNIENPMLLTIGERYYL